MNECDKEPEMPARTKKSFWSYSSAEDVVKEYEWIDMDKFEQINSQGFELKIAVVLTSPPDEPVFRYLPEGFLINLGVDPRTALKAMLFDAMRVGEITPKAAHYVMRYSKFKVVPDLGGRIVPY